MDRLKPFLLAIVLLFCSTSRSQNKFGNQNISVDNTSSETIFIHTNATTFVSGEMLYYKLYCLNPIDYKTSVLSKVAYVQLIDSDKKTIFNQKMFLDKGIGNGEYFFPSTLKTGTYKMVGYTKLMLNKPKFKAFEIEITIINPFQNEGEIKISGACILESKNPTEQNDIQTNKKTYSIRENVTISLPNLKQGNYSLSVRKIQDLPSITAQTALAFSEKNENQIIDYSDSNIILPEFRGELISGKIISKDGLKSVNNIPIALSIPGKYFEFKLVNTDNNGNFIFSLDKPIYSKNVVIQIFYDFKESYLISLNAAAQFDSSILKFNNEQKLSSILKNIIEEHSVASQIENAYFESKKDSSVAVKRFPSFYEPNQKEYILDNYTRFPSIKETITEVVKELNYFKNKNTYSLYVSDYDDKTEIQAPPLLVIDGLIVQDNNELLNYKADDIYKIDVIQGGYLYGTNIFNGLISFISKRNDFSSNLTGDFLLKTAILPQSTPKKYYKPDYSDSLKYKLIPDYRYQLLWLPEMEIKPKNQINFYTSDKIGRFEIDLEGFDIDGKPISAKKYFEVQ